MSRVRCEACGSGKNGPLSYVYERILSGPSVYFRRQRLCASDLAEWFNTSGIDWDQETEETSPEPRPVCYACGFNLGPEAFRFPAFYLDVYKNGEETTNWWARICHKDASRMIVKDNMQEKASEGGFGRQ